MPPKTKKTASDSPWFGVGSGAENKFLERALPPSQPSPTSPWVGVKNVPMATGIAESVRGAATPQVPVDMTLTGDMAGSSPHQKAAAAQFEANMRDAEAARGQLPQTPEAEAAANEVFQALQEKKKMEEEARRIREGRLY